MSEVRAVTDAEFDEVVLASEQPVLVDFWAEWCAPCKQLSPIIDELADTYGDRMLFTKVDADTSPESPAKFMVQGLPTILIFSGGEIVASLLGGQKKSTLVTAIEEAL